MSNTLSFKEKEHWKERISSRIEKKETALCEKDGFMKSVQEKTFANALIAAGVKKLFSTVEKIWSQLAELNQAADKLRSEADKKKGTIAHQYEPKLDELDAQRDEIDKKICDLRKERNKKTEVVDEKLQQSLDAQEKQRDKLNSKASLAIRKLLAKVRNVPLCNVSENSYGGYDKDDIRYAIEHLQQTEIEKILASSATGRQILALREEKENLLDTVWLATSGKQIKELWKEVVDLLGDNQTKLQQDAQGIEPVEAE